MKNTKLIAINITPCKYIFWLTQKWREGGKRDKGRKYM
jgi:hypothetical protein